MRTIQRNAQIDPPTDLSSEIADKAFEILCKEWSNERPVRMITVTATNLVNAESVSEQINLFDDGVDEKREKNGKREIAVDKIREKFGLTSIVKASIINNDIGISKDKR